MSKITRDTILVKLEDIGTPLTQHWEVNNGLNTGCNKAFIINESKYQQLIAADSSSADLIKVAIGKPQKKRWKPDVKHVIWIPSSKFKEWPWSSAENELEAEQIFAENYPAISQHLKMYRDKLKKRTAAYQGKFYWELSKPEQYPEFQAPKIVFYFYRFAIACYDTSGAFVINGHVHSIQTTDLFLLAILNSKFFEWYVHAAKWRKTGNKISLSKTNMGNLPIAGTEAQKAKLSNLVQRILDAPNSPNVSNLEEEINMLVYALYGLTLAEIDLIEEETNK